MKYEGNEIVYEAGDWIIGHSNECGVIIEFQYLSGRDGVRYMVDGHTPYTSYLDSIHLASQEEINKATKLVGIMEAEFIHEFKGELITGTMKIYGKALVEVKYTEDLIINEIKVDGIKVDFNLPYTKGNIIDVSKRYLEDL